MSPTNEGMDGSGGAHSICSALYSKIVTALGRHSSHKAFTIVPKNERYCKSKCHSMINEINESLLECSLPGKLCTKHMTKRKVILRTSISTKSKEWNDRVSMHSMKGMTGFLGIP